MYKPRSAGHPNGVNPLEDEEDQQRRLLAFRLFCVAGAAVAGGLDEEDVRAVVDAALLRSRRPRLWLLPRR